MRMNTMSALKGLGALALALALAACGSGLGSTSGTSSSSSSSSSNSGGSNNTPPGIPNSIVFVPPASTNTIIALQGTGGKTNAEVTFQVADASNAGVQGVPVTFALIPTTGDAALSTNTGTTNADGKVSTDVASGTEHYSVVVQATVSTPSGVKTANSNSLAITTGIPTQNNFAMASATLTANNADDTLGVTDVITVQLSDRFNNPAPDGTAVSFITNTGQIPGSCLTLGGFCSVTWSSSGDGIYNYQPHLAGHVEILAFAEGEESFTDVDGDGVFDNNDIFTFNTGTGDAFDEGAGDPSTDDIGEVYLDGNELGAYQTSDFFHDFNKDGIRNGPDKHFYGFGCKGTAAVSCGSTTTKEIGKQICINASTSGALITPSTTGPVTVSGKGAGGVNVTFTVSDTNGNSLAGGTTVVLNSTITNGTVTQPINLPFAYADSGCGGSVQSFTVNIAQTQAVPPAVPLPVSGSIQLVVVTPGTGGAKTSSPVITLQ